jgi:iron complex transport system substrate-binding protein
VVSSNPPALRIVSLLPAATEIVCALGSAPQLVGISHECDFPEQVRSRPILTRSRLPPDASTRAIDGQVRELVEKAISLYLVDAGRLASLAPHVIVTQDLCEVCAVSLDDVKRALLTLSQGDDVRIVSLRPTTLQGVLDDVERVAEALGRREAGRALRRQLERRIDAIALRAARVEVRPRVASLEWLDPLLLGGLWMPELIELAGGTPVGVSAGKPAPAVNPRALAELRPDVVLIKPCGFSLERTLAERPLVERVLRSAELSARVFVTDGNAFFNRPGPRLVESLEILAACIHPRLFEDFARKHAGVISRWQNA